MLYNYPVDIFAFDQYRQNHGFPAALRHAFSSCLDMSHVIKLYSKVGYYIQSLVTVYYKSHITSSPKIYSMRNTTDLFSSLH